MLFVTNHECFVINQQSANPTLRQIISHKYVLNFDSME